MPKVVLLAGIPREVSGWLEGRLPGLRCRDCRTTEELRAELPQADLLMLDHSLLGGLEVLRELRPSIPVFYSLDKLVQAEATRGFDVTRLLVHPLDPEELLRHLTAALELQSQRVDGATAAIKRLWERHRPEALARARLLLGPLTDPEPRREAERAAHRLAGSAGSFGYPKVSELAREAEELLRGSGPLDSERVQRLAQRILAELEPREAAPSAPSPRAPILTTEPTLAVWEERLAILQRAALALVQGHLEAEGRRSAAHEARRLRVAAGLFGSLRASELAGEVEQVLSQPQVSRAEAGRLAERVMAIRKELSREQPVAAPRDLAGKSVLLASDDPARFEDLRLSARLHGLHPLYLSLSAAADELPEADAALIEHTGANQAEFFRLLAQLAESRIPTLVCADHADLGERVRATRIGVNAFIEPDTPLEEVFAQLTALLRAQSESGRPLLVVDDDPTLLAAASLILSQAGFSVVTESDPLKVWERLAEVEPELIILDVDMPFLNGIELCRVIRQDPRWGALPVLFLTANREAETIARLFAAGGDDYVMKPVVGPELVTRVKGRLERIRRSWTAIQTGQSGGRRLARERLEWLLQLGYRLQQPVSLALVRPPEPQALRALSQELKKVIEVGDVVARWSHDTLVVAMMATTRQAAREHLQSVLEERPARAALACFPADGADLDTLTAHLETALEQSPPGLIAGPAGADGTRTHDVLLVDDDSTVAELVVETLRAAGYTITWQSDPRAALEGLAGGQLFPRVLLLDVDMPGLDGFELLEALTRSGQARQMRVVMLTGAADSERRVFQAIEGGAFDYVAKPFDPALLTARVRRARESLI